MTRAFLSLSGVVECRLCRAARMIRLLRVKATVKTPDSGFLWFDGRQRGKIGGEMPSLAVRQGRASSHCKRQQNRPFVCYRHQLAPGTELFTGFIINISFFSSSIWIFIKPFAPISFNSIITSSTEDLIDLAI
jgi:hypothetical protein